MWVIARACLRVRAYVGVGAQALARVCKRVALLIQHATRCHLAICDLSSSAILFDIISLTIWFSKQSYWKWNVFRFSLQLLFETFLILRIIQRDIFINVKMSSRKVPVIRLGFSWNLNFLDKFSKKTQLSNFIKIRPVVAELFHADGQTDRHDEANSSFSEFCGSS